MRRCVPFRMTLAFAAAAMAGCRRAEPPREAAPAPVEVRVAAVRETSGGGTRAVPGVVAAREAADITARSAATVTAVLVSEGMLVRKGQRLARLDSGELAARISAAESALSATTSEKVRTDRLAAAQAATPREKELADSAAAAARASLAEARAGLSYLELAAPFAGRVASVPIHAGDHVQPGEKLIALESDAGFEAQASIEGGAVEDLTPGRRLTVRVDGFPGGVSAVVRTVSPAGDPETHRFLLRADLPADPRLRSGLFASVEVPDPSSPARRVFPASALVERGGLTGVFVVEGGRASLRWIEAGPRRGDEVEARAGLAPGDTVVVAPGDLTDGAPVVAAR